MLLRSKYLKLKEPRKINMLSTDGRNREHHIKMDSLQARHLSQFVSRLFA